MRSVRFAFVAIGLATMFLVGAATAAVIYEESVDGDLPKDGTLAPLLTLALGTNDILGNTGVDPADFDSFRIHVPIEESLVEASVTLTLTEGSLTRVEWDLMSPFSFVDAAVGTTTPAFADALPLGAGDYTIRVGSLLVDGDPPRNFANYKFSFEARSAATTVPEPSTLVIAITLFGGAGFIVVWRCIQRQWQE